MSAENMMCTPLYSDMASVTFGLYENKDERLPYALFIVNINDSEKEIQVFTSEECIGQKKDIHPYGEWIKKHPDIQDTSRRSILRYEPYVTSYDLDDSVQTYDEDFFNKLFRIPCMDLLFSWPVYKDSIHVVVYKDKALTKDNPLPELMRSAYEAVYIAWREYFKVGLYTTLPPRFDVKEIIESLDGFKEMAPFFETVSKISSLFYEKSRSMGSITVMRTGNDVPLVPFITETEADTLSFSIEHAKQLRKLLETTKNGLSLLVHEGKVYGIGEPAPTKSQYTFNITGHMEWHVLNHGNDEKGIQVLRYKHGEYYLPIAIEIRSWYIRSKIKEATVLRTVNFLLKEDHMKSFEHGALLIITDEAEAEVKRLCTLNRGLRTDRISMSAHFEKTSALCAIDGALFLDKEGDCHGIGIILDGEAIVNGTPARGSRYNSAKTYISRCVTKGIEAYALIMSSDSYLDILNSRDEEFDYIRDALKKEDNG